MAVELAVTGAAAAAAAAGGGDKAAGSSSSDSDVNDSDLDSDSDGEHEELRAVVDRMMKEESDEDDDGGGEAPRCVLEFFFFLSGRAKERKNEIKMLRTGSLTRAFPPQFHETLTGVPRHSGCPRQSLWTSLSRRMTKLASAARSRRKSKTCSSSR